MTRVQGVAVLSAAFLAFYGCGGDDDSTGGTGAAAGRSGAGGHAGVAGSGAKAGSSNQAGNGGTGVGGGRGGTSSVGGSSGTGGTVNGGRGGTSSLGGSGGTGCAVNGGRGGTSSVGGSAGEAGGGQAGAEGGASPGTGGTSGGAGENGAGNGGEAGQRCTPGADLVDNGDFETSNASITTEYQLVTAPTQLDDTGQCIFASDASTVRQGATDWAAFGDHTSGSGQMLICDGNVNADRYVWSQTVAIEPHKRYELDFWFTSVEADATFLPSFQGFADGVALGTSIAAGTTAGGWTEYSAFYEAADNTTVTLSIVDTNVEGAQNDFALDDVSFALTCDSGTQ